MFLLSHFSSGDHHHDHDHDHDHEHDEDDEDSEEDIHDEDDDESISVQSWHRLDNIGQQRQNSSSACSGK